MKVISYCILLLCISCLIAVPNCVAVTSDTIDYIVAIVNDDVITMHELMAFAMSRYFSSVPRERQTPADFNQFFVNYKDKLLTHLVEQKLLAGEARKEGVTVTDFELEMDLKEFAKNQGGYDRFLEGIRNGGIKLAQFKKRTREKLMVEHLIHKNIYSEINVQLADTYAYWKANIDEFTKPAKAKVKEIFVKSGSSRSWDEAQEIINGAYTRIKTGEKFEDVARLVSEGPYRNSGGDMGFIKKGELLGVIDDEVFSLPIGQVSKPIKSKVGYHILLVTERIEKEVIPFNKVSDQIKEKIFDAKFSNKMEEYLKELKKKSYISIKL